MTLTLSSAAELGERLLDRARLLPSVEAQCRAALCRPGRLFSATPAWAQLCLAWIEALVEPPAQALLPAVVACDFLAASYDLIDRASDHNCTSTSAESAQTALAAAVSLLLLAQEVMARLDVPAERRVRALAALGRAGQRALVAHGQDVAMRRAEGTQCADAVLLLRQRSGTMVAAPCQCMALLAGAPWRTVALAGRFGLALGCAAQLDDDLADRQEDVTGGRRTIPVLLTQLHPDEPELVETVTWVLMRRFLHQAAESLRRVPVEPSRTEALWRLLPHDSARPGRPDHTGRRGGRAGLPGAGAVGAAAG